MTELSLSEGVFFRLIVFLIVNLLKSDNHVPNVSFRMATKQETIHCCQWFKICVCYKWLAIGWIIMVLPQAR